VVAGVVVAVLPYSGIIKLVEVLLGGGVVAVVTVVVSGGGGGIDVTSSGHDEAC